MGIRSGIPGNTRLPKCLSRHPFHNPHGHAMASPPPRGSASYKKQDGTLSLSKDSKILAWTPVRPPGSKSALEIPVPTITNLQQTPVTNPKVMLKVFAKGPSQPAAETHVFSFTAPNNPRAEADAIKDALSKIISTAKASGLPAVAGGGADNSTSSSSAAMAIASAVSSSNAPGSGPRGDASSAWYDDSALVSNQPLQQSLLRSDPALQKTFLEALRTKPPSISAAQLTSRFWASRLHLLRSHAIEGAQSRGQYNVLASIKPVSVENSLKLNVSKEQIALIFSQHPLVKRVYDENVPKLSEERFWTRFFTSRLFKKLKGEKITEVDATDPVLDKYLNVDEEAERAKRLLESHVPHIIDVEGNEENHSQRKGNQPDITMRAKGVPIIRTINDLSEKIMAQVAPHDVDPSLPIGMDEETFNSLALRDLQADKRERQRKLDIRDSKQFFSSDQTQQESEVSEELRTYAEQDPLRILSSLRNTLRETTSSPLDLAASIGVDPDSDASEDDDDDGTSRPPHVGSTSARSATTRHLMTLISARRSNLSSSSSAASVNPNSTNASTFGLSSQIFDRLTLTHATTTEFLSHFWTCFLSGDASRAEELSNLITSLDRALERIHAVADAAEEERGKEVTAMEGKLKAYQERTGKKARFDWGTIKGGRAAVEELMAATVEALAVAVREYRRAVEEAGVE